MSYLVKVILLEKPRGFFAFRLRFFGISVSAFLNYLSDLVTCFAQNKKIGLKISFLGRGNSV